MLRRVARTGASSALLLALCALAVPPAAEALYVIEQTVVAVRSSPDPESARVAMVRSGDSVEVIERQGEQAHVRLAGGADGWIKGTYLTADEPLQKRLNERSAELQRARDELVQLRARLAQPQPDRTAPEAGPAARPVAQDAPAGGAALLPPVGESHSPGWPWLLAAGAAGLTVGFGAGWWSLDRYLRRRYGGIRVY